jgi:low affinity Fe/Cu permease
MSCFDYDTQKWAMISFASVAITLIIGLVLMQYAHGQDDNQTDKEPKGVFKSKAFTVRFKGS